MRGRDAADNSGLRRTHAEEIGRAAGGAFIVYESIIDDDRTHNTFGLMMSLNMLIETPGGFDYSRADCMGWMKKVGFSSARVQHLVGPDSMVVGIK